MQNNYRYRYLVVILDGNVYVYKFEIYKFDPPFHSFHAKNVFNGKSKVCPMTEFSSAGDKIDFEGKTVLLECEIIEYVYFSRLEIFKFKTDDKIIGYISLMCDNMIPFTSVVGEKYTYFISTHYIFIENNKIEGGTLLNATNDNSDPSENHLEKSGLKSFKKLECSQIHLFYPHDEQDVENEDKDLVEEDEEDEHLIETNFCNRNNGVVRIFNQKCVICYERDSVYAFTQCGHLCICEKCYLNRGDNDFLKCIVCGTYFFSI